MSSWTSFFSWKERLSYPVLSRMRLSRELITRECHSRESRLKLSFGLIAKSSQFFIFITFRVSFSLASSRRQIQQNSDSESLEILSAKLTRTFSSSKVELIAVKTSKSRLSCSAFLVHSDKSRALSRANASCRAAAENSSVSSKPICLFWRPPRERIPKISPWAITGRQIKLSILFSCQKALSVISS